MEEEESRPEVVQNPIQISVVDKPVASQPRQLIQTEPIPSTSRGLAVHIPQQPTLSSISPPPSLLRSDHKRKEKLYKILVIGDIGVGKTSVVKRYVHRFFSQQYRATVNIEFNFNQNSDNLERTFFQIGVDFALKIINWDQNTVIRLQLWDIAGQERFGQMTRVYYKDAIGAFIVFDVTRAATYEAITKWKKDLDIKVELPDGSPVPCVLLGNKCDQGRDQQIPDGARMDQFLRENNFSGFFETSAKENIGIDEAARFLLAKIIENDHPANADTHDPDRLRLDAAPTADRLKNTSTPTNCSC